MLKHLILLIPTLLSAPVYAQEIFMSIAGKNSRLDAGDRMSQFDIWIRPTVDELDSNASLSFDVFDAGLGGISDLVHGDMNTTTTFELSHFDALFYLDGDQLLLKSDSVKPLFRLAIGEEPTYKNRWATLFQLPAPSANGWIVRVFTDLGDDINQFKPRLTGDQAQKWQIVALNLAIGLVDISPSNRVYFLPLFPNTIPPSLSVIGEDEIKVELIDGFGRKTSASGSWSGFESKVRDVTNPWGIVTSGSARGSNNFVIQGKDKIIPFIFEPQLFINDEIMMPEIRITPTDMCLAYGLRLTQSDVGLDLDGARWYLVDAVRIGREIIHTFPAYSAFGVDVIIPTVGRLFPRYVLFNSVVVVNEAPQVTLTGFKPRISQSERILMDASASFDPELRPLEFSWFVNGELQSTDPTFAFLSHVAGRFEVRLVVSDGVQPTGCATIQRIETILVE